MTTLPPPVSDTSRQAHDEVRPRKRTLRDQALEVLRIYGPMTADEAAEYVGVTPFAMRPRFTELRKMDLIRDAGKRRSSGQGKSSAVWELVPPKPVNLEQGRFDLSPSPRTPA